MGGFSSVTGDETIMFADNVSFDGTQRGGKITTDGQLLIGATAAPHIRPGTLTSSGGTVTITPSAGSINLEVAGGSPYISLSPYIVGSDVHSGFATIQSAIAQAVTDGASVTNQKNVYIKPKSGGYTENLTLSDGINLVGFAGTFGEDNGMNYATSTNGAVLVNGTITISTAAECSVNDLEFTVSGSTNPISLTGDAYFKISKCSFNLVNGTFLNISTASPTVELSNSIVNGTGTAKLFATSTSGSSGINIGRSAIVCITASTIGAGTDVSITAGNSNIFSSIDASVGTSISLSFVNSTWTASGALATYGAATTGSIVAAYCALSSGATLFSGNASSSLTVQQTNCTLSSNSSYSAVANYSKQNNINLNASRIEQKFNIAGFQGSEYILKQAQVQTTDATVTTLASVTVNQLESITLQGQITGAQSDHTNAIGGNFLITARRASGGNVTLVGSIVTNVNSSSAATFTVDVDTGTQTVRIRITGVAATTYNWVTTYNYQKVLTNA